MDVRVAEHLLQAEVEPLVGELARAGAASVLVVAGGSVELPSGAEAQVGVAV